MTAAIPKATAVDSDMPQVNPVRVKQQGRNFSLVRLGQIRELMQYGVKHPMLPRPVMGKVFLKEPLGLSGMEISFGVMPAHRVVPFLHKHRENEEIYLFIHGKGQMLIDDEVLDVEEGTAVRIAPDGARCWRNTSAEDLFYIVIQAKQDSLTAWSVSDGIGVPGQINWPKSADETDGNVQTAGSR